MSFNFVVFDPWSDITCVCMCTKSLQSCPTLCDPVDSSPPGSSSHGILQARILEWVAMPLSREFSGSRMEPLSQASPALAGGFLHH